MLCKAIEHGKEHRKPYRGSKRFDTTCRNHGSCNYCERNRLINQRRIEVDARLSMAEYSDNSNE